MDDLTPEQIQFILSTINSDDQMSAINGQLQEAQALRGKQYDPSTQAGRVVIPNINALMGPMIDGLRSRRLQEDAEKRKKDVYDNRQKASQEWLQSYLRSQQQKPMDQYDPKNPDNPLWTM